MSAYHFVTRWQMPASPEKIYKILSDVERVARFWPSLYKSVKVVRSGDGAGLGKIVAAETKGPLPYSLQWTFTVTEASFPHGFTIESTGDLVGRGEWKFTRNGDLTDIEYTWDVVGEKPLLKFLSPVLRPLFSLNHGAVMKEGERGLRRELMP
jgi:hypothetical protein